MSEFTNICVFCCRDCNVVGSSNWESEVLNPNKKTKILHQFVKLAERYLNTSFQLNTANENKGVLESCRECCLVLESFCSSYHKLKCLEMELESKLRMLYDAINSSRSDSLYIREDVEVIEGLKSFRTDFQQKCVRQFSKAFPRVSINRLKGLQTKQEVCQLSDEDDAGFNQLFLGWISTLAAVFVLGIGNLLQKPNEISDDTGEQHHILISELVDDDNHFEHDLTREDLSYYGITSNKDLDIGIPVNQLISRNTPDSESKCRKLLPPVSLQLNSNSVVNAKKQRDNLSIEAQFRCFCCSRNFTSFPQLQRHRRAFTHALMKRKMLTNKRENCKCLRKSKRLSKNSKLVKTYKSDTNENVGVFHPLRNIRKQSVVNGSDVDSLKSDDDESSCPSDNDLSSCSSSSISSGEEFELSTCSFCDKKFKYLKRHQWKCRGNPDRLPTRRKTLTALVNGICNIGACKEVFKFKEMLENHKMLHGTFTCKLCKEVANYAPDLALHESNHMKKTDKKMKTKNLVRYCARCDYSANNRTGFINHYLKKHLNLPKQIKRSPSSLPKPASSLRVCDAKKNCYKTFENEEDLANHRKLHGKFACSFCPVVERYAPKLAVHETTHVESALVQPTPSGKSQRRRGQPYNCSRCTSVLHGRFEYVTHFLKTHLSLPSESVTCQNCGDKFPETKELRTHFKFKHNTNGMCEADIVKCDECTAFFQKPVQLVAHKKKMHGEDNSTCLDCGRKFANSFVLRSHRALVHKIKEADFLHVCHLNGCERRFERVAELAWHKQLVHDGKEVDKSLVCHECGKKLLHKAALASHMRLHQTDKIPKKGKIYVCEECGKFFKAAAHLTVHKLSHTGPTSWEFSCIFCDKKSATERLLMEHITSHTNEKSYICEICGEEYTQHRNLRNHKNKKHDANVQPQKRVIVNGQESKKGQKLPRRMKK